MSGTDKPDAWACRTTTGACLMSETFFHLLGPGTQPNDDSFS
ncbi:hydrogenase expression/formation protein, partial [Shigella sonnei]|nr:hydrogenase expression/formation protein [Shigella sonnei]